MIPSWLDTFNESNDLAADRLGAADGADALTGLGLDVDRGGVEIEQARQVGANVGLDRAEFGFLGEDNDIDIDNAPAVLVQPRQRFAEKTAGVGVLPGG